LLFAAQVWGQVQIGRFIPGNYRSDNLHRVEIYNPGPAPAALGGFLVITRDYSVRIPDGAVAPAGGVYAIGKVRTPGSGLNLELASFPDFLIRIYSKKVEGNYVLLLGRQQQVLDAFYYSQLPNVPFLPDTGTLILRTGTAVSFKVPTEDSDVWGYYPVGDDPAIGFMQVNNEWRVTSSNPKVNLHPTTAFKDFAARYTEGVVALGWSTEFEDNLPAIRIERSEDQENFTQVGEVKAAGFSRVFRTYRFLDATIQPDKTYYYRLTHIDPYGNVVYSRLAEITTTDVGSGFWMEVFPTATADAAAVRIRFSSAYSQRVKIKLLDADGREVALLYATYVYADVQNLLRFLQPLPPGQYRVVATTDDSRYVQDLVIEPTV